MINRGNRPIIALVFLVLASALAAPAAWAQQPPPPVSVAKPLQKQITEWDEFTGRFEAVETVEVRARISGVVDSVHFRDGQLVKQGELLYVIDRRPFQIDVDQAIAARKEAEATVKLTRSEVKRAEPLVERGTLSKSEYDERLARQLESEARLEAARSRLAEAQLNLEWTRIRAPISGRISDARIDVGNLISGGQADATLLTTIVSLDPIHFEFFASEADYLKYSRLADSDQRPSSRNAANPVVVRLADETEFKHKGAMDFVDNVVDTQSGTMRGRAIFENRSLFLTPGVFGRMRLFGGRFDAFLVPDEAIVSDQARKIVYVVGEDNVVKAKVVTLGPIVEGLRVVRAGLEAEDRLIVQGIQRARTGQKVTPEETTIKPKAVATN